MLLLIEEACEAEYLPAALAREVISQSLELCQHDRLILVVVMEEDWVEQETDFSHITQTVPLIVVLQVISRRHLT